MRFPHLFEFMDQEWLNGGLRSTLREILECGNGPPFRSYYPWVASEVLRVARERDLTKLVELGAGTAPITRWLAQQNLPDDVKLIPCDRNPDVPVFQELAAKYDGLVQPEYESVDFSEPRDWNDPEGTLLYLSATLHHIRPEDRIAVLQSQFASADTVMVFEPLRKTPLSVLFVFLSIVPAILVPILHLNRTGRLRRFLWCWLFPAAPIMFVWDGIISCLRQWSATQWNECLTTLSIVEASEVYEMGFSQSIQAQRIHRPEKQAVVQDAWVVVES